MLTTSFSAFLLHSLLLLFLFDFIIPSSNGFILIERSKLTQSHYTKYSPVLSTLLLAKSSNDDDDDDASRPYKFGDITRGVVGKFQEKTNSLTGKSKYELGKAIFLFLFFWYSSHIFLH